MSSSLDNSKLDNSKRQPGLAEFVHSSADTLKVRKVQAYKYTQNSKLLPILSMVCKKKIVWVRVELHRSC